METKLIIENLKQKNLDLKRAEIEGILFIVKNNPNIDLNKLVYSTGLPKQTLKNFLNSSSYLNLNNKGEIEAAEEAKEIFKKVDFNEHAWSIIKLGDKEIENTLREIRRKYGLMYDEAKREYDQFFATIETSVQKALILEKKGLIDKKSIALIGDDDLVSIVLALKYPQIARIQVLEIDDDLIKVINKIANDYNLNINVLSYDARNDLPPHLINGFDAVLVDPPYTSTGIELFLDRSISLVKQHTNFSGSYVFLNYGNSFKSPEKTLKIQEIINRYNLIIEDKINKFNFYRGAESIGSTSSLYVLKRTPQTQAKNYKMQNIYTYEVIEEKNFPYVEQYTFKLLAVPDKFFKGKSKIDTSARAFARRHNLKITDFKIKTFTRGLSDAGLTFTYILNNSNFIIHTWPEYKALHIDIVTCSPIKNPGQLTQNLAQAFQTNHIDFKRVE